MESIYWQWNCRILCGFYGNFCFVFQFFSTTKKELIAKRITTHLAPWNCASFDTSFSPTKNIDQFMENRRKRSLTPWFFSQFHGFQPGNRSLKFWCQSMGYSIRWCPDHSKIFSEHLLQSYTIKINKKSARITFCICDLD